MRRNIKPRTVSTISIAIAVLSLLFTVTVWAGTGTTDSSNPPGSTSSYTLEDIYNSLNDGTAGTQNAFTEPSVAPGIGTMHSLNDIYNLTRERAPVPKTGQTASYATGDDGDLERGVAIPATNSRFTDNGNGTVTDNLNGLIWLKNANCWGTQSWANALSNSYGLANGSCGLTDGSVAGDWRLADVRELFSLIDFSQVLPALPGGHPFIGVQEHYWTSTTHAAGSGVAWTVFMNFGRVDHDDKLHNYYLWPVRGGQ